MSKEIYSVVISEDEYAGIPYQKIKDDLGHITYYSCGVSFESFADFKETVDSAINGERAFLENTGVDDLTENDFFDYLTHDEKSVWEVFSGQAVES